MNIGAGGFWKRCWRVSSDSFSTACLITSFCLFLFYRSFSRISGTHKSDCNSAWHRSAFLQMAQWFEWKVTEMVQRKWGLCCCQLLLCFRVPNYSFVMLSWFGKVPHALIHWPQAQYCGDGLLQETFSAMRAGTESSCSLECFAGTAGLTNVI